MMLKLLLLLFLCTNLLLSANDKILLDTWITAGPIKLLLPYNTGGVTTGIKDLLNFEQIDLYNLKPAAGDKMEWGVNKSVWGKGNYSDGKLKLGETENELYSLYYAATYLNSERWVKGSLEIKSCYPFKAYLNGVEVLSKESIKANGNGECTNDAVSKEIKLERGVHTLILKVIKDPAITINPELEVSLTLANNFNSSNVSVSSSPSGFVSINNLLDDPKIGGVSISPDGELAAVTMNQIIQGTDKQESWIDIYRLSDGALAGSFRGGMKISSVIWSPEKDQFAYTVKEKEETDLWIHHLGNKTTKKLLDRVKDFGSFRWSPEGSFIIYSTIEKPTENKTGLNKINDMRDRLPNSGNRSSLYLANVSSQVKMRLTTGDRSANLVAIRPDGKKIIYTLAGEDYNERPYSYSTYYMFDLETFVADSLFTGFWSGSAQFSPDYKKLIITGGPSLFGEAGVNVEEGLIPNEYDNQVYLYDLETESVVSLTKDFDPSVRSMFWSKEYKTLYLDVNEAAGNSLYKYNWVNKSFTQVKLNCKVVNSISFAEKKPMAVYYGSSETTPQQLFSIDLNSGKSKLLLDPGKQSFKYIKLGETKDWNFTNSRGVELEGTVYYPPGFDVNKKYPLIVFYYGGTTPVSLEFEGRYPKNIWAANGYVVYIIQPSGAIGYGQNFSALHVNDWGEITADEIISATKEFVAVNKFIDESKVGCIGASYGGFMTMDILTKTDLFAAAVSHAGISSLASYWGEGYWGYTYSAVATANSFPWNRQDIYVNRSPLFKADKINTPLLLLHGESDTNVPPGESDQMFTSLKLLGKEVDYIRVAGQDHHILEYNKRKLWTKSIIAWFDKYLKGEPEWYEDLYPRK